MILTQHEFSTELYERLKTIEALLWDNPTGDVWDALVDEYGDVIELYELSLRSM